MVERRYTAIAWELSTFGNVRSEEIHGSLIRDNCLLTMRFTSLSTILVRKVHLAKMNDLPKHRGAEPPEARVPMQLHRLHRLRAGPDADLDVCSAWWDIANSMYYPQPQAHWRFPDRYLGKLFQVGMLRSTLLDLSLQRGTLVMNMWFKTLLKWDFTNVCISNQIFYRHVVEKLSTILWRHNTFCHPPLTTSIAKTLYKHPSK